MPSTKIEFAHETINPLVGCSRISPGCKHCYAVPMAHRLGSNPATPQYAGATHMTPHGLDWTGEVRWVSGVLEKALVRLARSKTSKRLFHCSMSDLCHEKSNADLLARVLAFAAALPQHKHIIITKRPYLLEQHILGLPSMPNIWDGARRPLFDACNVASRERFKANRNSPAGLTLLQKAEYIGAIAAYARFPLSNVMLMATVEDRPRLEERGPHMRRLAALGWHTGLIFEPLLECVNLEPHLYYNDPSDGCALARNDWTPWIVVGHEQGPGARLMSTSISGDVIAQACRAGAPVFFKKDSHGGHDPDRQPRHFPAWMLVEGEV